MNQTKTQIDKNKNKISETCYNKLQDMQDKSGRGPLQVRIVHAMSTEGRTNLENHSRQQTTTGTLTYSIQKIAQPLTKHLHRRKISCRKVTVQQDKHWTKHFRLGTTLEIAAKQNCELEL